MTALRYDQAADAALETELQAGRRLVVLRPAGSRDAEAGQLDAPHVRTSAAATSTLVATAVGVALSGVRPVVQLRVGLDADGLDVYGSWTFESVAVELAAASLLASGGVTILVVTGAATASVPGPSLGALGALLGVPGVKLVAPATVLDCYGLVRAALQDPGHVVVLESAELADLVGEVPDGTGALPLGSAEIVRSGNRMTIVAGRRMRSAALEAGRLLAERWGVDAEVIDPRSLVPFDDATVGASLQRTARLLVVADEPLAASWGAALIARLTASHFTDLDAPPRLVEAQDGTLGRSPGGDVAAESIAAAGYDLASW